MAASGATPTELGDNAILAALPPDERARLEPLLETVEIPARQDLYRRGEPVAHAYFPVSALASVLSAGSDGRTVEVGAIGRQGFVGLPLLLEDDAPAFDVIGQVAGLARRMTAAAFRAEARRDGAFRRLLLRATQAQMTQSAQAAACNRLHEIDQRTARWLAHCADWTGRDSFALTQEFLAYMLGVRRPSVTTAAALMQRAGFITYKRGAVTVLDPDGLRCAACECYGVITDEYRRLLV
jgi:CRP-like cAMP-binding protein